MRAKEEGSGTVSFANSDSFQALPVWSNVEPVDIEPGKEDYLHRVWRWD